MKTALKWIATGALASYAAYRHVTRTEPLNVELNFEEVSDELNRR